MPPFPVQRRIPVRPVVRASVCLCLRRCLALLRLLVVTLACLAGELKVSAAETTMAGEPLTRLYPLEEIGCTLSGIQLLHDAFGRVAVAQQDELFVLNDTTWQKVSGGKAGGLGYHRVVCAPDGNMYYGAFGAWGGFRKNNKGELEPFSLVPPDTPEWTKSCDFRDLLCTDLGVFVWGQDGVVFLDKVRGAHSYFRIGKVAGLFPLNGRFVASTFQDGFFTLDLAAETWARTPECTEGKPSVIAAAGNGTSSLLVATMEAKFLRLREGRLVDVSWNGGAHFPGPILAMVPLPEGGFAAAVAGLGVVLFDEKAEVLRILDGADYRSVAALEATEPGVLWAVTERGVLKILHPQPFSTYGREQGLHVHWPQLVEWQGRLLVSSGGRVFETLGMENPRSTQFRQLAGQPNDLGWGIAVVGGSLLIGGGNGVDEVSPSGTAEKVLSGLNVARLVPIDENTCVVIAVDTIALLRRTAGKWSECAERVPGVGYSYVVHAGNGSAWLELGMNKVARISLAEGRLRVRLIEEFSWTEPSWVNVSVVGPTVVFSAASRAPMFLDERTLEPVEAPELRSLIEHSPHAVERIARDETGTLWLSHSGGLFPARIKGGRYEPDLDAFRAINEAVPLIQCPKGGGVWASTEKRLYRLNPGDGPALAAPVAPVLVALKSTRTGTLLPLEGGEAGQLGALRHRHNSLQLDFFAGSYAWTRPLSYEYRLGAEDWRRASAGSSVFLADLPEGDYAVEVRAVDRLGPIGKLTQLRFSVEAPWFRSWVALISYPLAAFLVVYLAMKYSAHRQRVRLAELEFQVQARTTELRTAMDCLREEATNSATLAERNRLAGEIHDSLEQGFVGLFLQLESTSRMPACVEPVRSGLGSALRMVQYCRDELRNAVRGLHSPVLDNEPLDAALRRIAGQVAPLAEFATVRVEGTPRRLNPAVEHHLLRMAQEALGNAAKHAGATQVEILLAFAEKQVRLSVKDNGCGFDPDKVADGDVPHLGLPGFRTRAQKIGGVVELESKPGVGTTVRVLVSEPSPGELNT